MTRPHSRAIIMRMLDALRSLAPGAGPVCFDKRGGEEPWCFWVVEHQPSGVFVTIHRYAEEDAAVTAREEWACLMAWLIPGNPYGPFNQPFLDPGRDYDPPEDPPEEKSERSWTGGRSAPGSTRAACTACGWDQAAPEHWGTDW